MDAAALTERVASLAGDPPTLLERDALFRRAVKQRRLYEALEPRLNAREIELPDLPILEQQLRGGALAVVEGSRHQAQGPGPHLGSL